MASAIERAGLPIVHITAVPTVSTMIGVHRIVQGVSVTNLLGNTQLTKEQEKLLRRKYVVKALEILQLDIEDKQIFTLGEHA